MKSLKMTLVPKSHGMKAAAPLPKGATPIGFGLLDDGTGTITLLGTDAAGNHFDISAVATLSPPPVSDTPATVTISAVGTPVATAFKVLPATPVPAIGATAGISGTVTWTDGSKGPFPYSFTETIEADAATGVVPVASVP